MDWLLGILVLGTAVLLAPPLRRRLLTGPIYGVFKRILPQMSATEREAIAAGTVGWDAELFSGRPDWPQLFAAASPVLSAAEQEFLDGPCEELCRLCNDWETTQVFLDLSPAAWRYLRDAGFLGLIIPQSYGGHGFSASAHSQIVQKLASRCSAAAVSVMVPNSLGPAELLLHYGTAAQKDHYLPRLARGEEIPAFALTSPWAGSDAAAIPDRGVVCKGLWQGQEILGMRVTWEKRYITLGPVCTVLGLAFRLIDPQHLLGGEEDIGITCALVPADHPGVVIGRRHAPLDAAWQNGPNSGQDVFMPLDWIIGGPAMAGQGWRMLMECLAAGRGISLPASATGMAKLAVRATGGYARVRRQFKTPLGRFEGVAEALARMGGHTYLMEAARRLTVASIDRGEKPAVLSAIVKYHLTERARKVVNDAMDILGGRGICLGPNNFLGRIYQQLPVAITVEGANILTRSLIIFGQGAIRCHPYVLREFDAVRGEDTPAARRSFDAALCGHALFTLRNAVRALVMGLTGSHFVGVPATVAPESRRYVQQLTRFSAAFAFIADISMLVMGGHLKRREMLSARLGDILAQLVLCSATLKRFEDDGRPAADAPLMHWAIWDAMFAAQNAFEGVIANFPNRFIAGLLHRLIFPLGRPYVVPADRLARAVARLLIEPGATRDRLTDGIYLPRSASEAAGDAIGIIELALAATLAAEPVEARLRAGGAIDAAEQDVLENHRRLCALAIRVDDFPADLGRAAARDQSA